MVLGDWTWSWVLIEGLEPQSLGASAVRAHAQETTRMRFGFDPRKEPAAAPRPSSAGASGTARRSDPLQAAEPSAQ